MVVLQRKQEITYMEDFGGGGEAWDIDKGWFW